jgi:O-glycosyl hydrolase
MKRLKLLIIGSCFTTFLIAQISPRQDTLHEIFFNNHKVALDNERKIISWITPQSKAYDQFLHMRWNFIKTQVPNSPGPAPRSSYPQYYFYCAFKDNKGVLEPDTWMNDIGEKIPNWFENARLYYAYTGDSSVMKIIRDFVDYTIEHGTSSTEFVWPGFPYTTSNAGDTLFRGFTNAGRLVLNEIQVDHAGEMGLTYYRMYLYTGEKKYLSAALKVADVLAKNAHIGNQDESVWPYRVVMDDGRVTAPYGANWTGCYMLLENLVRANLGNVKAYKEASDKVRNFILQYPMKTGYWTDGHSDTDVKSNTYKSNLSASNTALCLFDYPDLDPDWKSDIPRLIKWTEDNFVFRTAPGEPSAMWGANIVGEQDSFNHKMDYQTARYAAECARWYAISGDESYKEKAFRSLNWVTYCNDSTGMAFESPVSKGILSWWSDCYGECPRMFYHAFAAVPEWAPPAENHILYSEGILKNVRYEKQNIQYIATKANDVEYLRLAFKPKTIILDGTELLLSDKQVKEYYTLKSLGNGDYAVTIRHTKAGKVVVNSTVAQTEASNSEVSIQIDGSKRFQQMDGFGVNINTAWWYSGEYGDTKVVQPAIDLLVDSLGATIFRAVIEEIDWEAVNDDNDPNNFNWTYYNSIFSNARFQGVWNTLRYLNRKGITNDLIISFMGAPPAAAPMEAPDPKKSWMGSTNHSINDTMEDELVESMAALLYYMRHKAMVQFTLVSPMNETDVIAMSKNADHPDGIVEGPNIADAIQYIHVVRKLAEKLDAIGMGDIRFVAPDAAGEGFFRACLDEMVKDSWLMSKLACWGVHDYGNDADNYKKIVNRPANPGKSFWVTETAEIGNMFGQLDDNPAAIIFWDGFDCVYQHGRRNGYGSLPPNDWCFWVGEKGKPLIEYNAIEQNWMPRKQFYEYAQLFRFIKPGAIRIAATDGNDNLVIYAFLNPNKQLVIVGRNSSNIPITVNGTLANLSKMNTLEMFFTDSLNNLRRTNDIAIADSSFSITISANSEFTLAGKTSDTSTGKTTRFRPEPSDWYSGDMHVHRNCGEGTSILPESEFTAMMEPNDLAVISVLADMGDGEVKDSKTDLPKVNGTDAVQSVPGRTVHWDAEWHFDPAGTTFENKALGGHIVLLGLSEAHHIWDESPYKILVYGRSQHAIVGFCHMQYLKDSIPGTLDCCTPIDFPVEAALGTIDFLAEDVWLNDASVNAYYMLLNCGFRLGWAAGTDFPCNNSQPFGSLLTYVQVKDKPFSYRQWVEGIKNGRTVVTTNGHHEFLDLKVNGNATPGDEIRLKDKGTLSSEVIWTSVLEQTGRIELVLNGKVVAVQEGTAKPGEPVILKTSVPIQESSWLCARRMDEKGHKSHTAPVYVTLKNTPVRASSEDARYLVKWIDKTLVNTAPGGPWNKYFTHDLDVVRSRYRQARRVYEEIALEATKEHKR